MATSYLFRNGWFGKAVFTTTSLALAPFDWASTAIWAAVGFGLGFQFDQFAGRDHGTLKQSVDSWRLLRQAKQHNPWMIFTFAALGHMSHIAGPNNPERLSQAKAVMRNLRFDAATRLQALDWYRAGKADGCPLAELAALCRQFGHLELESFALTTLKQASKLGDNPDTHQQCELTFTGLALLLGISASKASTGGPEQQSQAHDSKPIHPGNPLPKADALRVLGVATTADKAAIKLAYRRLASQHHPDRLPNHASDHERKAAADQMARLNSAMEVLQRA